MIEKQSSQIDERKKPEKYPVNLGPLDQAKKYSGFIIVRLSATLPVTDDKTLIDLAGRLGLNGLVGVLERYKLSSTRRVVQSLSPQEILLLERQAAQTKYPPLHSLTAYWRIRVKLAQKQIDEVLKQLNELKEVDLAYQELGVSAPVNAGNDPLSGRQDYLDAAPNGINARWAWDQGWDGAGIRFIDVEQGYTRTHEDLVSAPPLLAPPLPALIYGNNKPVTRDGGAARNHGTAVLGIVVGADNTRGIVGIAPGVASARLSSHFDLSTGIEVNVADAITAARNKMNAGDVLLLEVQRFYMPSETDEADWDAINLASAAGIIVIEAAGNGNRSLDIIPALNRSGGAGAGYKESGAIMVGSSVSSEPHHRYVGGGAGHGSNYGSRIDCYAWGENVVTAGYGDLAVPGRYTDDFGGTSGASAIIAGAALIIQGVHAARHSGSRLTPAEMRALLSNPATATPQGGGVAGNIGVMPNLEAIIPTL
jgi:hypothetical protein